MQLNDSMLALIYGVVMLMWRELLMFSLAVVVYVLFYGGFHVSAETEKDEDARAPRAVSTAGTGAASVEA